MVIMGSSVPGRVSRCRPAWRKCMIGTIRLVSTIELLVCQRLTPLVRYAPWPQSAVPPGRVLRPARHRTAFRQGRAPQALNDDTAGRVRDRLYDFGTMRLFTACAVRAATRFGLERRSGHFDTTSRSVWGDYQYAEAQDLPFEVTYGYSKDKRPDLKQFILSTLCVDRAVPIWGKLDDGNASDKTLNTNLLSELARLLADYGVRPGAYIYIADAALVSEDNLSAL